MNAIEITQVAPGESVIRQVGDLCYVAAGAFKEYDARFRTRPVIVNFLGAGDLFANSSYTVPQYLKAIITTELWIFRSSELKMHRCERFDIYDHFYSEYHSRLLYRSNILACRKTSERIERFNDFFKPLLPYLSLRDIANYTAISYDHFIRYFSR